MTKKCPVCLVEIGDSEAACPQCGFKFLGSTQEFNPIVFEEKREVQTSPLAMLRVVRGPQVGTVYKLDSDEITLGRNPQCDIFLNDMTVSRIHAKLTHIGNTYVISDVDSFNGVWVNNVSVSEKAIKPGDVIQIGKFAFVYDENE